MGSFGFCLFSLSIVVPLTSGLLRPQTDNVWLNAGSAEPKMINQRALTWMTPCSNRVQISKTFVSQVDELKQSTSK